MQLSIEIKNLIYLRKIVNLNVIYFFTISMLFSDSILIIWTIVVLII
jgi:hypothetical protein